MTGNQRNKFFALCDSLNIDKNEAMERAKIKFNHQSFTELKSDEISGLIEFLEKQVPQVLANAPKADFPDAIRIWDRTKEQMHYVTNVMDLPSLFNEISWEITAEPDRVHIMHWTGMNDESGQKLYDFDLFKNSLGKLYIVQWSWKDVAWVGYDADTNELILLSSFGKRIKVGDIYTGVKEDEDDKR